MTALDLTLTFRPPLDWASLLGFLAARATPGVESVDAGVYRRTVSLNRAAGSIAVSRGTREGELNVRSNVPDHLLPTLQCRLKHLFDLAADSRGISEHLAGDPLLSAALQAFPGIRVPGSWDPFETAVRAIIGQVVSVKAASSLTGRLVAKHGERLEREPGLLTHLYPTPELLAEADLTGLGLSGQKTASIRALAQAVAAGSLRFDGYSSLAEALERLQELPGVGPWTANYIAMRALRQADAFPAGDLILKRAAAEDPNSTLSERELISIAERWRPYRAYAAMLLWASYARNVERRGK